MKWLHNFKLVMRSNLTSLRERIEDPERMIHQLLVDMESELDRVRGSVAEAIADEIQLARQVELAGKEATSWGERARKVLRDDSDDEAVAREALARKVAADGRRDSLSRELAEQRKQTARLQRSVEDLESKIRQARQRRTILLARMVRSESTAQIHRALDRATGTSAFAEFRRLEERVERSEARTAAHDRLAGRAPADDELEERFREKETRERVDDEMERLKKDLEEGEAEES